MFSCPPSAAKPFQSWLDTRKQQIAGGSGRHCLQAQQEVMEQLNATGKGKGLRGFEMLRAVHLEPTEFSVENDLMTPSFKVTAHLRHACARAAHLPDSQSSTSLQSSTPVQLDGVLLCLRMIKPARRAYACCCCRDTPWRVSSIAGL